MTKSIIPAFSTGVIAPELASSIELAKAQAGLFKCENMIIDALGGAKNRPGTQFITGCYDSSKLSRLITFQFNVEQAYILEFSDSKMRVLKDGAVLLRNITDSLKYEWTSGAGSEYFLEKLGLGDPSIDEPLYVLENGVKMTKGSVSSLAPGEWGWGIVYGTWYAIHVRLSDSTDPDTKATGYVQIPVSIDTPYPIADVGNIDARARSADVIYFCHPKYDIQKLTRTSDVDWTITTIPRKYGAFKGYVPGDEETRINALRSPVAVWTLTASSAIFNDVLAGDGIRLGFPIPADLDALHWTTFSVSSVTSDTVIEVIPSTDTLNDIVYQQIQNYKFKDGLVFWEERSDLVNGNSLTYDATNKLAVLTHGSANSAKTEQIVITFSNVNHLIKINVDTLTGTSPTVVLNVGTATGLGDIFTTTITTIGKKTFDVLPTQETIYINLDTVGSTNGDIVKIDSLSLMKTDVRSASTQEQNTTAWRLGAWNAKLGFPSKGIIHEQRLKVGGSGSFPQTIWCSKLGDYEKFEFNTPTVAVDSFSFNPSTSEINGILWFVLQNGLNVGTADEKWKVFAASGGATTPTDVNTKVDNSIGSLDLQPLVSGNSIIMTPRGIEAVVEITSSFETSGYVPRDLSVLAYHLFEDRRIVRWAYAKAPDSVVWSVLDNGTLKGMTYKKEYDIWAWHTHTTPLGEGFKDIAVIPNSSDDNIDDVYFIVNRAVAGATPNYYIEQLNKRITSQTAAYGLSASGSPDDFKFFDSALTLDVPLAITNITQANPAVVDKVAHGLSDGDFVRIQNVKGMVEINNIRGNAYIKYKVANKTANDFELNDVNDLNIDSTGFTAYLAGGEARKMVDVISNLGHLEGQTVTALADGSIEEGLVVSGGSTTIKQKASFIHIGLAVIPEIETLDLELLGNDGSTQGRFKSVTMADIYFKDSRGAEVATSNAPDKYWNIDFQNESDGENPPPLFTGSKETKALISGYDKEDHIKIRGLAGLPIHIKRIVWDVDYGG